MKTGLTIDAYFAGTKVRWILEHVEGAKERARERGTAFWYGGDVAHLETDKGKVRHETVFPMPPGR